VDRADPHDVARAVAYAARLLSAGRAPLLWIFPQAEIVPPAARPVTMHGGATHILRRATNHVPVVGVLPVAWLPVFRGEHHPEVVIRTGPILRIDRADSADHADISARVQTALTCVMDALQADLTADDFANYRTILRGREGV